MNWRTWIGLPHAFGADPEDGEAADCLVMVWKLLDAAGIKHPKLDPKWLKLAQDGRWGELETLWQKKTRELPGPQEHAVTLFKNGPAGLGVGIVLENGLLMVHHRRGVCWAPISALRKLQYCEFS